MTSHDPARTTLLHAYADAEVRIAAATRAITRHLAGGRRWASDAVVRFRNDFARARADWAAAKAALDELDELDRLTSPTMTTPPEQDP